MASAPAHSRLPPSKSAAWHVCTASVGFIEANANKLPPDGGAEADEGTRAHLAASTLLLDPNATPKFDNDEMAGHVGDFIDFVRDKIEPGDTVQIEQRVPLFYYPQQRGTMDVGIVSKDRRRLWIIDLKYGAGTPVYARKNTQLAIYAESWLSELEAVDPIDDDALITLAIFQPRDRGDSNPIRLWALSRKELAEFVEPISAAALAILSGKNTRFVAGEHCDKAFCRGRGLCPHYANQGLDVVPEETLLAPPTPQTITREQRVRILKARPVLEKWFDSLEGQEIAELMAGGPRSGLKLVKGKPGNRAWTDEVEAAKLLSNHLAVDVHSPRSVLSVTQAEKALKGMDLSTKFQNKFNAIITRSDGKPTLVAEEDKRPALSFDPAEGLEVVSDEEDTGI